MRRCIRSLVVLVVVTAGAPPTTSAGGTTGQRSLAEQLRYGPGQSNHPVGVEPSEGITIPEGWPLDEDGTINCRTCHEQLPSLEGATDTHLRDFDAESGNTRDFCAKCHTAGDQRSAAAMHWMAVPAAHLSDDNIVSPSSGSSRMLDQHTRQCMGCHDGVSASDADNPTPWNRGRGYAGDRRRNHPVGVSYPTHTPRDYSVKFRPAALLPPEVQLPDGKVSCVSCHNLYSQGRSLLTVSNERSALCFTCHDLK